METETVETGQPEATTPNEGTAMEPGQPMEESGNVSEALAATAQGNNNARPEDTFFDPNEVPPELLPAYKNMQAQFTRRQQQIANLQRENEEKLRAYDQFMQNPQAGIEQLARQYGMQLTPQQAAQAAEQQNQEWQPQTWDEVLTKAREQAEEAVLERLQPVLNPVFDEVKTLRRDKFEATFDKIMPGWREYETEMVANLQKHPSLRDDPETLLRMSVPQSVVEANMYKKALDQMQSKVKSAQAGGAAPAGVQASTTDPNKKRTLHEAYLEAKRQLGT